MYRNAVTLRGVTYQTGLRLCMQPLFFCVESWTALVISFCRRLAPEPRSKRKADAQASHPMVLVSLQSMYSCGSSLRFNILLGRAQSSIEGSTGALQLRIWRGAEFR
mmetsp:Transcript_37424/g.106161  ORF Transcript_37424/g.106161 Transcript_37424/m.106161 type:complete len:107 (-) Transcript_37424:54-374(-)